MNDQVGEDLRVFLVAAEPSGDTLGAGLAAALAERLDGRVAFSGVGGPRMAAHGVASPFNINELAVLGLVEGLRAYPRVVRRADETVEHAVTAAPDVAVLIDSWGFTLRVAQRLRRRLPDLPLVKYVAPQVWASRPGRAKTLAATIDHVLTLRPFEPPHFEAVGLKATFVGHPALEERVSGDGPAFRARYGIDPDAPVLIVLFGSRRSEIARLTEPFLDAVDALRARFGEALTVIAPLAASVATAVRASAQDHHPRLNSIILVDEGERDDAFAAATAALAASGTVTTELATAGVPTVTAYKLSPPTHVVMKRLYQPDHISLVNITAGRRIISEFLQSEVTGEALAEAVARFIDDPGFAAQTRNDLLDAVTVMRGVDDGRTAYQRAADAVLETLKT